MLATIINRTNSPHDIQSITGPMFLPATGEIQAEFDDGYLDLLEAANTVQVVRGPDPESKGKRRRRS